MAPIWSNMLFKCAKHMDNTCFPYVFPYENHIVLTLSHMFFMCSNHVMLKTGGLLMCFICFPCGFHVLKSCVYHIFKTCRKHLVFKATGPTDQRPKNMSKTSRNRFSVFVMSQVSHVSSITNYGYFDSKTRFSGKIKPFFRPGVAKNQAFIGI